MGFVLTWERDEYIAPEELVRAIGATGDALGIPLVTLRRDEADEDAEDVAPPAGSHAILRATAGDGDDDLDVVLRGPVALEASLGFSGYALTLFESTVQGEWAPAYLFTLHLASSLGMRPEDGSDDPPEIEDDVRHHVEMALLDAVDPDCSVEVAARAGAIGPLEIHARRDGAEPVLEVRGAGVDVACTVTEGADAIDDAALARVVEALRTPELEADVDRERARRLAQSPPPRDPRHAGQSVLRLWIGGVAGPPRVLDTSATLGGLDLPPEVDPKTAVCDLVHYLPDGQAMVRRAEVGMPLDEPVGKLWLVPSWCWAPEPADAARSFRAVVRGRPASAAPPPQEDAGPHGLTLARWLAGFSRITGRLGDVSASALIAADREHGPRLPRVLRPDTPVDVGAVPRFLAAVAGVHAASSEELEIAPGLVVTGEWFDDSTDAFIDALVAALGLPEAPKPAAPAEGDAYLATLNAAAEALGLEERLYSVPTYDVEALVIKLRPAAFEALRAAGLLVAEVPVGPGVLRPSAWQRLAGWWAKRLS